MSNPNAANQEIRQALQQVLAAADQIGNAPGHPGSPTPVGYDETQQGLILQAWEKLALLTGNHDLARKNVFEIPRPGHAQHRRAQHRRAQHRRAPNAAWIELQRNQPVVPPHQLRDSLQAMGAAMFHIGSATLQYGLIQGIPSRCGNAERYLRAENDARIAHAILHRTYTSLATGHPRSPEIRKHCRQANLWLTRDRSRGGPGPGHRPAAGAQHRPAARRAGLGPPRHGPGRRSRERRQSIMDRQGGLR